VVHQLTSWASAPLPGHPGTSYIVGYMDSLPLKELVQVIVEQGHAVDSSCASDHGCVESENFDSDDDLEVKSEPAIGSGYMLSGPLTNLSPDSSTIKATLSVLGMEVPSGPKVLSPTRFLLEYVSKEELTVVDKLALLSSRTGPHSAESTN